MCLKRCQWCLGDTLYESYHDNEWGVPIFDDTLLFEFLVLETFQSGLSWITILRKREFFREAFDNFDAQKIVTYNEAKINTLLNNPKIIRNKAKIMATIANAKAFIEIKEKKGSFANYIWDFVDGKPIQNKYKTSEEMPVTNDLAKKIAKELKEKGFKFIGPIVMYSHMEATGMMNNHLIDCFRYEQINALHQKI